MSGVLKTVVKVGAIVGAIALAIPSGGTSLLAASLGVSAAAATGIVAGLGIASSLLSRPKAPPTSTASADRLTANIDPKTPRKFAFGKTAFATDIRDQEFSAAQDYLHRFIVCASHTVESFKEIWLDDKLAWSAVGGVTAEFAGYFDLDNCTKGSAAEAVNVSPRMGTSRRYTGLAYVYLRFKLTGNSKKAESPFAQSVPTRITIVGNGALLYDPRLDSTVPGGSGPMRPDDQSTWIWNDDACRNPALQLLWYLLGWRIQNPVTGEWKLAVGKGIPPARIDLPSFITAANLCDEPVTLAAGGTQPRYRSDGLFSEGDATSTVLDQLKASMNAELDDVDGKIRITVLHNDLATPVADFSEDDILGAFTWEQTAPLEETFNVVRGTFIDPSSQSLYQAVDFPEVRIASPDGIDRIQPVNFQTVQDASQAQRLAKQRIARMLYSGRFTATFGHRAWKVQKNDVIRLTFAPLGWTNKLFRVVQTAVQVDGQVPMVLQVEHPDIYLWDADERPAIEAVEPTTYDPYLNPIYQDVIDPKYGDGTTIDTFRLAVEGQLSDIQDALEDIGGGTGEFVVTGYLTNPSFNVFAYADGTLVSTAGASGTFIVRQGNTVVPASSVVFTSTASSGVTGSIDTDGNYSVTGLTVDNGALTLTATYAGVSVTQVFKVTRTTVGYEIVSSLPSTNLFEGRLVFLNTDGKLYRYHAGAWTAAVSAPDISGQLIASQIADGSISIAKFAAGLQPVVIWSGASLPTTNQGNALFWTVNGKLYRWGGSAYTASVAAGDISGTIADAQIAGLAASKVTGTLTDSQLASISAAKVTGQIVAGQITDGALTAAKFASSIQPVTIVSSVPGTLSTRAVFNTTDGKMYRWNGSAYVATVPTTDLAGTIADAQLSAISATKITGTITSTQIADGSISTPKLAAGSITAGKIAAGTITASEIAAGTITGDRMAANTITSSQIAADTITAGNIAAGAIGASEIAAGAVTAGKMVIADMENLAVNGDFASGLDYWDKRLTKSGANVIEIQTDGSGWPSKNALFMRRALSSDSSELSVTNGSTNFNTDTALAGGFPIRPDDEVLFEAVAYALNGARPTVDLIVRDRNGTISSYAISWIEQLTTNSAFTRISGVLKNLSSVEGKAWIRVRSINATANNADLYWWNIRSKRRASGSLIVDGGITALKIAAGSITSTQIAADTITAANIAAGAITATELATGSVTAGKIAAGSIQALDIAAGTITGDRLAANTITSTQIAADTITAGQIAAGAIGASEIAAGAVTTNKLAVVPESILPDAYFRDPSTWQAPLDAGGWFFEQNTGSGGSINPYSMGVPSCITLEAQPAGTRKHAWGPYVPYSGSGQVVRLRGQGLNSGPDWIYYKILFVREDLTEAGSVTIGFPPFSNVSAQSAQASVPNGTAYYRAVAFNAADVSDGTSKSISAVKLDVAASAEMIVDGSITAAKIVAGSITGDRLAANTITAGNIASEQITADKLAVGAVTAGKIAANAVTALTISVDTITANKFVTNEGVDLAALVPGSLATNARNSQIGTADLTSGSPNYTLPTTALSVYSTSDLVLLSVDFQITASTGSRMVYIGRSDNAFLHTLQSLATGTGTFHFDWQDPNPITGNVSYSLLVQLATGTLVSVSGAKISYTRVATK